MRERRTQVVRRLAARAKNIQIRCNDLADEIAEAAHPGATELRAAAKRAEDVFKYLMKRADDVRDAQRRTSDD